MEVYISYANLLHGLYIYAILFCYIYVFVGYAVIVGFGDMPKLAAPLYHVLDSGAPYIGGTHDLFPPLMDGVGIVVWYIGC